MNATATPIPEALPDADLLRRFVERKDEPAFAALVARHGRMVYAVCRARLGPTPDADDATQATFLTLAQRAPSLLDHPTLAGWLYRVARHVSLRAAATARRRQHYEREAAAMQPTATPRSDDLPTDLLHDALARLPEKYRVPLLLHHMEGLTQEQVAAALKLKTGTLSSLLTRGRAMLRTRLVEKGVALSAATAAPHLLSDTAAAAALPPALLHTITASAAAVAAGGLHAGVAAGPVVALTKGALNMLALTKMKTVALAVLALLFVTTTGAFIATNAAQPAAPAAGNAPKVAAAPPAPARGKLVVKLAELDVMAAKAKLEYQQSRLGRIKAQHQAAVVPAEEFERSELEMRLAQIDLMAAEVKLEAAHAAEGGN